LDCCLSAPPAAQVFTAPILAHAANGVFSITQFIREVTHCKLRHNNAAAIGGANHEAAQWCAAASCRLLSYKNSMYLEEY
jgi:hypothetical protein